MPNTTRQKSNFNFLNKKKDKFLVIYKQSNKQLAMPKRRGTTVKTKQKQNKKAEPRLKLYYLPEPDSPLPGPCVSFLNK